MNSRGFSAPGQLRSRWTLAAAAMAVQALVVAGCAIWLVVSTLTGSISGTGRAITEAITIAIFAIGAGALSFALWRERSVARTPTLVWDGFVVVSGGFLARSGAPALGAALVVFGLVAFIATLRVPPLADTPENDEDGR